MSVEKLPNQQLTDFSFTRSPSYSSGLCQLPAADDSSDAIFVRLHAPIKGEIISWTAKSEGGAPQIPSPFGVDCPFGLNANQVFLGQKISAVMPQPQALPKITNTVGSAHIFLISGVYFYGFKKAGSPTGKIPTGKLPYETFNSTDNTFPDTNFINGVLDETMTDTPEELVLDAPLGP